MVFLRAYYTFSFDDYYNPQRIHFGALRAINDIAVISGGDEGIPLHQNSNMEIVTIPLQGSVRYQDSLQNSDIIGVGEIGVLSTGGGVSYSEMNDNKSGQLNFLQLWIESEFKDAFPSHHSYNILPFIQPNRLSLFMAPGRLSIPSVKQDVWLSWGDLKDGVSLIYQIHRQTDGLYIFVIKGEVRVGSIILLERDGMSMREFFECSIEALKDSIVLLIEVPIKEE